MTYLHEMVVAAREGRTYTITVPYWTSTVDPVKGRIASQTEATFTMPAKLKLRDRTAYAETFIADLRAKFKEDPFFRFIFTHDVVLRRLLVGHSGT
jgi:hypothetical protein